MRDGMGLVAASAPEPEWARVVPGFERTPRGFRFLAPAVDMSVHLPWLVGRLRALGGSVERRAVRALGEVDADAVVNCAGLGVRELADAATTEAIVARCAARVPAVAGARVLSVAVGLRPARPAVRLEAAGRIVHCYGHGGAGVTLAAGCAAEVAALVTGAGGAGSTARGRPGTLDRR
jgi:glycine/D-amino acid oxidase-like deaminating enzyme